VIFEQKIYVGLKKPNKTHFEVVFLGGFFWVLLSGFFWAGFLLPTLQMFCMQTTSTHFIKILCHLAYGHFASRNRLGVIKLCVKLSISLHFDETKKKHPMD
jgi:hypothetical protein